MNFASLATRYRPQSFAEVTGQDTIKAVLSRAAAEDRVAPAYLLSGTRGVGKTTIARIFAKALNCEHAPTAEPCNECEQCRMITQGNHVDVMEIDGASNRRIDDARRLRENINFAPMQGRYKIYIIDEAHMLTRESFNALLKTLEEPPERTTFIMATTEAHKFPITIVSRCQHFVFKSIPEEQLVGHLVNILNKEGIAFEENAVRLLARRGAGSVRDSMSLLGQVLALSGDPLTEAATRSVLGMAGQELYQRLLQALHDEDCLAVTVVVRELLDSGTDLGFFLRELASLWRNLFLVRQAGPSALGVLNLPDGEKDRLLNLAKLFDLTYIHAAWHMVLESQRQILTSMEPASALELLLLNLALLPRLISFGQLSNIASSSQSAGKPDEKPNPQTVRQETPRNNPIPQKVNRTTDSRVKDCGDPQPQVVRKPDRLPVRPETDSTSPKAVLQEKPDPVRNTASEKVVEQAAPTDSVTSTTASLLSGPASEPVPSAEPVSVTKTWEDFLVWCDGRTRAVPMFALRMSHGQVLENRLEIVCPSVMQYQVLAEGEQGMELSRLAGEYFGSGITLDVRPPTESVVTDGQLKDKLKTHPLIVSLTENFDGRLVSCVSRR